MVQASASSSGESGSGGEGGLTAEVPLAPPSSMLVLSPAVISWAPPLAEMMADPLYRLTSIEPFWMAEMLALPIRVISAPLIMKRTPAPSGMVIIKPSKGTSSHWICPRVLEK